MSGSSFLVPSASRAQIRGFAGVFRQKLRLGSGWLDIVRVAENVLPSALKKYEFQILEDSEMQGAHGLTFPDEGVVQIAESVYIGACKGQGRDRMTIAHELGHLMLHANIPMARRPAPGIALRAFEDSEWQANAFGGELLCPHGEVLLCNCASELVTKFGVSLDAAEVNFRNSKK